MISISQRIEGWGISHLICRRLDSRRQGRSKRGLSRPLLIIPGNPTGSQGGSLSTQSRTLNWLSPLQKNILKEMSNERTICISKCFQKTHLRTVRLTERRRRTKRGEGPGHGALLRGPGILERSGNADRHAAPLKIRGRG